MKRFLKVFCLLLVSLFALVSGVDSALDHYTTIHAKDSLVIYNENGTPVIAYEGALSATRAFAAKPGTLTGLSLHFVHRT